MSLYTYTHARVGAAHTSLGVCTCACVHTLVATLLVTGVSRGSIETIWFEK